MTNGPIAQVQQHRNVLCIAYGHYSIIVFNRCHGVAKRYTQYKSITGQQWIRLGDETPINIATDPSFDMIKVFAYKTTKTSLPMSKVKTVKGLCAAFAVVWLVFF
jgi:hypothetical protein